MGCAMQDSIETTPPCAADADDKKDTLLEAGLKQQQPQPQTVVRQQLKEQHSALVRLLESAPLTKNSMLITKSLSNTDIKDKCNLSSNVVSNIPETSPHIVAKQQHQRHHHQHHFHNQHQNAIYHRKRLKCDIKRNNNELVNDSSKCTKFATTRTTVTTIESDVTMTTPPASSAPDNSTIASDTKLDLNKCPWKKIRFARELKQKELLENSKQKCDNAAEADRNSTTEDTTAKTHDNKEDTGAIAMQIDGDCSDRTIEECKEEKHTAPSLSSLLSSSMICRRDSSDSNCSTISNSNLSQCTCYSNGYDSECDEDFNDDEDAAAAVACKDAGDSSSKSDNCMEKQGGGSTDVADLCQKFNQNLSNEGDGNNGFFRRSIQQKIQYRPCTKNQQCSILRINRNRCQYCRLKKCIAVGMSRDAVRFGRVPKREKARILAAMQQSTQNRGQQRALATELDDQPRLLAAVLRAHMDTCEFTKEKVSAMRQRARECPSYSMPTLLACPLNPAPELQSEQEFSQRFAHVIRGVIDFAGMIPGFQLLTQDDKFTLLKAGLFDALFVRLICMFDPSINSIICLNGQVMRRDAIQNGANARFLVDSTFNFAERINSMNLTDTEIGLFCAIVLITPDRPGLRNIELIEKMYTRLKACLQTVIAQNRPDQPEFMSELLKTLPDLRTLSTLHTEKLVVFRTEHKELLRQQMWTVDDDQISKSPGSSTWETTVEDVAKSPLGSVSSTESGDLDYSQTSLASSAPLLAATLSGTCPLRHRANSGSSAEDIDIVGSHAHLTQNGLSITPVARSHHSHSHLNSGRYRKLDSPTDSGIESGNEKAESTKTVSSGGGSSCSSPRSTVEDVLDDQHHQHAQSGSGGSVVGSKRQIGEDMPVLKRVLQAPPLYDTNSLMDEAYKPHKKFRALRHRDFETAEADTHLPRPTTATPPVTNNSSSGSSSSTSSQQQPQPQSQLHMHLTRNTNSSTNNHSSLSSTHSVLAKSLMEEPRMTPEQMKRSDIIQNYIMREQPTPVNGLLVCASSSPTSSTSSSSTNLNNCSSSSTTTITLSSPPLPPPHAMRWQGHSVITTTTLRNQSASPVNNGVNSSNYFQSPHSTSISSSPRASPLSRVQSPRLIELQVDIADSQQPLNLSKKSPTPPPPQHQKLSQTKVVTTAIQRSPYHHPVAADITVTTATTNSATGAPVPPPQVHKVLLEA